MRGGYQERLRISSRLESPDQVVDLSLDAREYAHMGELILHGLQTFNADPGELRGDCPGSGYICRVLNCESSRGVVELKCY